MASQTEDEHLCVVWEEGDDDSSRAPSCVIKVKDILIPDQSSEKEGAYRSDSEGNNKTYKNTLVPSEITDALPLYAIYESVLARRRVTSCL